MILHCKYIIDSLYCLLTIASAADTLNDAVDIATRYFEKTGIYDLYR